MTDVAYALHQQAVDIINRQTSYLAQHLQQVTNEVQAISVRLQSTPSLDIIDRAFRAHKELEDQIKRIYILVQTELETAHKEYQEFIQISKTLTQDTTEAKNAAKSLNDAIDDYNALDPSPSELINALDEYDITQKGLYLPRAVDDSGAMIAGTQLNLIPKADDNTKRTLSFGATQIHNDGSMSNIQTDQIRTKSIQAVDNTIDLGDANSLISIPGTLELEHLVIQSIEFGDDITFNKNITFAQGGSVQFLSTPEFENGANFNTGTVVNADSIVANSINANSLNLRHSTVGNETNEIQRVLTASDYDDNTATFIDPDTGKMKQLDKEDSFVVTYGFLRKILENFSGGMMKELTAALSHINASIQACLPKSSSADLPQYNDFSNWALIDESIRGFASNMKQLMTSESVDLTSQLDKIINSETAYTDQSSAYKAIAAINMIGRRYMIASLPSNQSKIFTANIEG